MNNFAADITAITYKEVAAFWGMNEDAAMKRTNLIRSLLGKKRFQRLTKAQYCKAEDISIDEFNQVYNERMNNLQKKNA